MIDIIIITKSLLHVQYYFLVSLFRMYVTCRPFLLRRSHFDLLPEGYPIKIYFIPAAGIPKSTIDQTGAASQPTNDTRENNDLLFSSVHELMNELKTVFGSAADKQLQKEELLMALQVKLSITGN